MEEKEEKKREDKKEVKIAYIILRKKSEWTVIRIKLAVEKISYTKAHVVSNKSTAEPATEENYRKMNSFLMKRNVEFHAFDLRSKKPLKVVLKGVPYEFTKEEIREDLEEKNYRIQNVTRINVSCRHKTNSNKGCSGPLVHMVIPLYVFEHLLVSLIQVESLNKRTDISATDVKCSNTYKELGEIQMYEVRKQPFYT